MRIKFNPLLKNSLTNLCKVLTMNYIAICVTVLFLATNAFLLILIEIRQNIKKRKVETSNMQYLNILVGSLETPHDSYLYDCQPLKCDPNSNIIAQAVDDAVRNLGINRSFFCLLLSDTAKYMVAVGIILKSLYPKLFHVTCVAHLLHNFAMKIKSHFEDMDQLIAKNQSSNN